MGNFFRCVRARANLHALMTQKSCAVGMRNAILRNHLKEAFSLSLYRPFPFGNVLNFYCRCSLSRFQTPIVTVLIAFQKFVTVILLKCQGYKMKVFNMFITAVCVIFSIKLQLVLCFHRVLV